MNRVERARTLISTPSMLQTKLTRIGVHPECTLCQTVSTKPKHHNQIPQNSPQLHSNKTIAQL
uniref:Uncharacterized protein n=1 Tax=Lotus japonicus TaxID=34305 RepID=I3SLB6_LOTJA|nr:unknown [Lotus japonicus]